MLLDAEDWAKDNGFSCFYLCPKDGLKNYYKECGYVDFDDQHMIKKVVDDINTSVQD